MPITPRYPHDYPGREVCIGRSYEYDLWWHRDSCSRDYVIARYGRPLEHGTRVIRVRIGSLDGVWVDTDYDVMTGNPSPDSIGLVIHKMLTVINSELPADVVGVTYGDALDRVAP